MVVKSRVGVERESGGPGEGLAERSLRRCWEMGDGDGRREIWWETGEGGRREKTGEDGRREKT